MAITHEQLYRSGGFAKVDFAAYVKKLIENIMSSFAITENQIELECRVDEISLDISKAVPCGLILNELITNAFKHVFSKTKSGKLVVEFYKKGETFYLAVADNGMGMPVNLQNTSSLGLTLMDLLCKQLKGSLLRKNDNGLKVQIVFPDRHPICEDDDAKQNFNSRR
jgi:two-component sensor histidine kinase